MKASDYETNEQGILAPTRKCARQLCLTKTHEDGQSQRLACSVVLDFSSQLMSSSSLV